MATYNKVSPPTYKSGQPVRIGDRIKYMGVNGNVTNVKPSGNVSLTLNKPVMNNNTENMSNVATVKYVNVEKMITKPIGSMVRNENLSLGGKVRSNLSVARQLAAERNAKAIQNAANKARQNAANKALRVNPNGLKPGNSVSKGGIFHGKHVINSINLNGKLKFTNGKIAHKNGSNLLATNYKKV